MIADTFGSDYYTALGVFSGTRLGDLHQEACAGDRDGNVQVGFAAKAGRTYYFQVTGPLRGTFSEWLGRHGTSLNHTPFTWRTSRRLAPRTTLHAPVSAQAQPATGS